MGQYYHIVDIDKKQYMYSWDYGSGVKLMEHSYVRNNFVEAAAILLLKDNPWYKTHLVWAGDYGDDYKFLDDFQDEIKKVRIKQKEENSYYRDYKLEDIDVNLYQVAEEYFKKIDPYNDDNKEYELEDVVRYFFNESKKEYVDIKKCRVTSDYGHIVHPLPLLTSNGNGRGGGDYHLRENSNDELYIGSWAGDVIFADRNFNEEEYKEYKEIIPDFMEE